MLFSAGSRVVIHARDIIAVDLGRMGRRQNTDPPGDQFAVTYDTTQLNVQDKMYSLHDTCLYRMSYRMYVHTGAILIPCSDTPAVRSNVVATPFKGSSPQWGGRRIRRSTVDRV